MEDDKEIFGPPPIKEGLTQILVSGDHIRVNNVKDTSITFSKITRDTKGVFYLFGRKNGFEKYGLWKTSSLEKPQEEITSFSQFNSFDGMDGIAATAQLKANYHHIKVAMLTLF
jgi:hypothetical protein